MSEPTRIPAPVGVAAATQYSHGVIGTGRIVAVSRLPLDERGEPAGAGDPAAQARQVFVRVAGPVRPVYLREIDAFAVVAA
ncbi:hypothetical protein ACIHCM_00365 [Streptomyces sp. NPDC052023]|uniref:hypothetical protein n=1 Tax=Streptomyces sp. NPDC052023 TaxID=3365681 RepID=UPI0037D41C0A